MKRVLLSTLLGLSASLLTSSTGLADEVHLIGTYTGKRVHSSEYFKRLSASQSNFARLLERERNPERLRQLMRRQERQDKKLRSLFPSRVDVLVTRTGTPLTLVLTAYELTKWKINLAEGVTVKKIILSGYHEQSLRKNSQLDGVEVEKISYEAGDKGAFYFYQDDRERPVGYYGGSVPPPIDPRKCEIMTEADGTISYESTFEKTLAALKKRGLVPTTVQGIPQTADGSRFTISENTPMMTIRKTREIGYCYRNPDGSITPGRRIMPG